ncbi:hypothetical protein H0H93_003076 [Arthromyces matolae]|nr:hypothetical protein H0H93_003076 [Arthromyces matolae]
MALAAPLTPENDVGLSLSTLEPSAETVPDANPKLFRRSGRSINNAVLLPGSSHTTFLTRELQTLLELKRDVLADWVAVKDKPNIEVFLRELSANLSGANERRAVYPKEEIYNAVKDLVNGVNTWIASPLRRQVFLYSMKCLQQTKPPGELAELPQEPDLKQLSEKIATNDPSWRDHRHWKPLKSFLRELEWTLEQAEKEKFPYNKLVVSKALMDSRVVVEEWTGRKLRQEVLSAMDRCLALNGVENNTPPAQETTFDSQPRPGTPFPIPFPATPPPTTLQSSHQHLHLHAPLAELRMSRLLRDPDNLENIFLLTGIMEQVSNNVCARRFDEWTSALVQMQDRVQKSSFTPDIQTWALERIEDCKKTLRSKWGAYQTPLLIEALEKLVELKELVRPGQMEYKNKSQLGAFLSRLSNSLTMANDRSASYPREAIYDAVKVLTNKVVKTWMNSNVKHQVVLDLMRCSQQTKPLGGFAELPQQMDLNELSENIAKDRRWHDEGRWRPLLRFLGELEWTLEQAGKEKFSYDKQVVRTDLIDSKAVVEKWFESEIKRQVVLAMDKCLGLIGATEEHPPPAFTTTV